MAITIYFYTKDINKLKKTVKGLYYFTDNTISYFTTGRNNYTTEV